MSDINWGILTNSQPKALDPVTSMALGDERRNQIAAQSLAKLKFEAAQAQDARQQAAYSQAATQYGSGNTRAAQSTLLGAGLNDGVARLNESEKQNVDLGRAGAGEFAGVVKAIHSLPYEQRKGAINAVAPFLISNHDLTQEQIDAFDPTDANLAAVGGYGYTPKDQDTNARENTQTTINQQNANTQQAAEIREERTPHGISTADNAYVTGGPLVNGGASAPGPAPTTAQAAPAPSSAALTVRLNNPGALRDDGSKWQGMTGVSNGFVQFDTPENGRRAQLINLANQQKLHGINTIAALVTKYAPASDGNDPRAYAATVAGALGVGVDDQINLTDPAIAGKVADAMARVEAGGSPARPQGNAQASPQGNPQVGPQGQASGPTLIQRGVPKTDPNAVDANDPAIEMAAQQYAATGDMPSLGQGQGQLRHAILTRAAQITTERHYTPAQIAANKAQVRSSTSALGADQKMYDVIQTSEQTALANGQRYIDLAEKLPGNTRNVTYNKVVNGLHGEFSDPRVTEAKAAYTTFISEYNRVINSTPTGAGTMSDASRREAMDTFENSTNQEARVAAFNVMKADMASRKQAQQKIIDDRIASIANVGQPKNSGSGHIPAGAISMLRSNPALRAQFDAKYGAGASASVLGH